MLGSEVSRCLPDSLGGFTDYPQIEADTGRRRPFCQADTEAIRIYCYCLLCAAVQPTNAASWSRWCLPGRPCWSCPETRAPAHPSLGRQVARSPGRPLPRPRSWASFPFLSPWKHLPGRRLRRKEAWSAEGQSTTDIVTAHHRQMAARRPGWKEEADSAGKTRGGGHANQGKVDDNHSLAQKVRGTSLTATARTVPRRCSRPDNLSSFQGY
jgi:hypothetical protein